MIHLEENKIDNLIVPNNNNRSNSSVSQVGNE